VRKSRSAFWSCTLDSSWTVRQEGSIAAAVVEAARVTHLCDLVGPEQVRMRLTQDHMVDGGDRRGDSADVGQIRFADPRARSSLERGIKWRIRFRT
jgi:hypothetical protein